MKPLLTTALTFLAAILLTNCQSPALTPAAPEDHTFSKAQVILERNCVHCHGEIRLPQMPSLATTKSLTDLIGPGKWIVPGKPDQSRLFQVVTLNDNQTGAMPPTGHKVSDKEIQLLRDWILAGAQIPADAPIALKPKGTPPRSR
jgi:mono/diheme cytochrome c family protein